MFDAGRAESFVRNCSSVCQTCRSGEEQSHKSPTPGGAVVLMSTVGLSSLFSFILKTRLAYDVSTNLELASEHADVRPVSYDVRHTNGQTSSGRAYPMPILR